MYLEHGDKLIMTAGLIRNHIPAQFTLRLCRTETRGTETAQNDRLFSHCRRGGHALSAFLRRHLPAGRANSEPGGEAGGGGCCAQDAQDHQPPPTGKACARRGRGSREKITPGLRSKAG